jgi:hypothetical protein
MPISLSSVRDPDMSASRTLGFNQAIHRSTAGTADQTPQGTQCLAAPGCGICAQQSQHVHCTCPRHLGRVSAPTVRCVLQP